MASPEPAVIVQVWPLSAAIVGAVIAPKYVWAALWASIIYVLGKVFFGIAGINPNGLASGYPFEGTWLASLLGQLCAVWLWTSPFYWMLKKVHASRAKETEPSSPSSQSHKLQVSEVSQHQRRLPSHYLGDPKLIFLAIVPVLAALFFFKDRHAINSTVPHSFKAKDCAYSVTFPTTPQVRNFSVPINDHWFDYEQAQFTSASGMLRAECIPVPITEAEAKDMLKRQVASDAFQNPSITVIAPEIVELRGYKMIAGEQGIYVGRIHHGSKSTLMLLVGGRSSDYPTAEATSFFRSVTED